MKKLKSFFFCFAIVLMIAPSTFAAEIYYTEAAFLGRLAPGYYLEDFSGWTYGHPYSSPPITTSASFGPVNGYSWNGSAPRGIWSLVEGLTTAYPDDLLTITFTGNPVTAIGGLFLALGGSPTDEYVTVALDDGTSITFPGSSFLGFISATPISFLTIKNGDLHYSWPSLELHHFYVGEENNAVPEPATMLLLGTGLAGLAGLRRRMRR